MDSKLSFLTVFILALYTYPAESFDLNSYRLPTWQAPVQYDLMLDLRNPDADTFKAMSWISINVTEENHYELVLNVDPQYIDINSSTILVDTVAFICDKYDYNNETQLMALTCMYDLFGNYSRLVTFEMDYTAKYSDDGVGLFKNKYLLHGVEKYVIYSQFEPTKFRRVFPSFDEPEYKATFRVNIYNYDNLTVASNMLPTSDRFNPRDTTTVFVDTPKMSPYIIAVIAGDTNDWDHSMIPGSNEVYLFSQNAQADFLSITKLNAPTILDAMGNWTGLPYTDMGLTKMTLAALPGMIEARENWGMIMFGERYLVDEGDRTTRRYLQSSLPTMAQEISYQWFGDYVTTDWWSETWLNEGFASYFKWHLADIVYTKDAGVYEFDHQFVIHELQPALLEDGHSAIPLSSNEASIKTPDDIFREFDSTISSKKGGSIIRMLRYALGEDVFQDGVQSYLEAKALGNVEASDFIEHLQTALPDDTDVNLTLYMDPWIHQPGYPIVKTSFGDSDSDWYIISIDIYKFSTSLNKTGDPEESIWWVPISYITSDNADPNNASYFWITPGRTFGMYVPKAGGWGIINAFASGFYRVDYDLQTMSMIANTLNNPWNFSTIATVNRAQLLDDLFNIAKYYTVKNEDYSDRPYMKAFGITSYLAFETEYLPWYTYLKEMQYLLDEIQDELTKQVLQQNILNLIQGQLVIPTPDNSVDVTHQHTLMRSLLLDWACNLGDTNAMTYAQTQFNYYKQNTYTVTSEYRDLALCYGMQTSNDPQTDMNAIMTFFPMSILPQEKLDIVLGIACVKDRSFLQSYLESTLTDSPNIDKHYWGDIFKTIYSRSPEGLEAALSFITNHITEINEKWKGAITLEKMFSGIASKIVKQDHIQMLRNLLSGGSLDPAMSKIVQAAIDQAEHNAEWINAFGTELTSVILYGGGTTPPNPTNPNLTTSNPTTSNPTNPNLTTTNKSPTTDDGGNGAEQKYNIFSSFVMLLVSFLLQRTM